MNTLLGTKMNEYAEQYVSYCLNFQILAGKEEVLKLETFKQKRSKDRNCDEMQCFPFC